MGPNNVGSKCDMLYPMGLSPIMAPSVIDLTRDTGRPIDVYIEGKPIPMPRPRLGRGIWFNPATRQLKEFSKKLQALLPEDGVVFPRGECLEVNLFFYIRRPNSDYDGNKRINALKPGRANPFETVKPDIDNLAKFTLDAMQGIVFHDDSQVVKLLVYKLRGNEGGTRIKVRTFYGPEP